MIAAFQNLLSPANAPKCAVGFSAPSLVTNRHNYDRSLLSKPVTQKVPKGKDKKGLGIFKFPF